MSQILHNGNTSDWKAWVLNIAILIIAFLGAFGVNYLRSQVEKLDMKLESVIVHNHAQDICLKSLEINQQIRLEREKLLR